VEIPPGSGFTPSEDQLTKLNEINRKLNLLQSESSLTTEDTGDNDDVQESFTTWSSTYSGPIADSVKEFLRYTTSADSKSAKQKGIAYLRDNRMERVHRERLKEISQEIAKLYNEQNSELARYESGLVLEKEITIQDIDTVSCVNEPMQETQCDDYSAEGSTIIQLHS
jgi:hypothetical protein